MRIARLHGGTTIEVQTVGEGPAVLLPVSLARSDDATAEQMRAWGADPHLGHTLATGLADAGFRVIAADYERHLAQHPKPGTLTAAGAAGDLLAVADAAGAARFAYYGYSWLALAGLQFAIRTDRLSALAMGGFPPLGGPYQEMLAVTRATHRMAVANHQRQTAPPEVTAGDWDSIEVTQSPDFTQQYVTLYESLQDFDERGALGRLSVPRLAFAGADDTISYGPKWGDVQVRIADAFTAHRDELTAGGWQVVLVDGADHMRAMQADIVLPILAPWLWGPHM